MKKFISVGILAVCAVQFSYAQVTTRQLSGQLNTVTTMVPFLTISPDSRAASMGDAGVAGFSPDANTVFWNASNLVNADKVAGFSISYAPWLRNLVQDVGYQSLYGYYKRKRSAFGGGIRYFSLGNINFTDYDGNPTGNFNPNEFAIDGAYALSFNKNFAMGVNLRYIYSNLLGNRVLNGISSKPGVAFAGDVNLIYKKPITIKGKEAIFQFGTNIQNIGSKMTYTNKEDKDFIPTNLKIGTGLSYKIDDYQKINFLLDINKLLVPTRPVYLLNYQGGDSLDDNGKRVYIGKNQNVSPIQGMLQSFSDAPGGLKEELNEYNICFGTEYWYAEKFALRLGLFYEAATKGNRKYITVGAGLKYQKVTVDAGMLIPLVQSHPLQGQLRFSLLFELGAFEDASE